MLHVILHKKTHVLHVTHNNSTLFVWRMTQSPKKMRICDTKQEDSYVEHTHNNTTLYILHSTPNKTTLYVTCDTKQEDSYVAHIRNNKTLFILRRTPNKTTRFITRDITQKNPCVAHIHNHKTLSILRRENTFCIPCNMKSITCNKSSRLGLYSTQGTNQDDSIYYT